MYLQLSVTKLKQKSIQGGLGLHNHLEIGFIPLPFLAKKKTIIVAKSLVVTMNKVICYPDLTRRRRRRGS